MIDNFYVYENIFQKFDIHFFPYITKEVSNVVGVGKLIQSGG